MAAAIGCDLLCWLRLLCLDGPLAKAEPKTLRYRLLHTAARLVRGQRKRKIKIPETLALGPGARSLLPGRLRATRTDLSQTCSPTVPDPIPRPARGTGARPSDTGRPGMTTHRKQDQKRR